MICCPNCGREMSTPRPGGLTLQQRRLLDFISEYTTQHGTSPSFDEMKRALRLGSKSGVHRLVLALEERGRIVRLENRARAIEVVA